MAVQDYNQDNNLDLLWSGNLYAVEAAAGPRDASSGGLLLGDGAGNFTSVSPTQTGFIADGDARGIVQLSSANGLISVVANNKEPLQVFSISSDTKVYRANSNDAVATITLTDGKSYKHEFTYGSAYLSQSARLLRLPFNTRKLLVASFQNSSREIFLDSLSEK